MRRVDRITVFCAYEPCQTPMIILPWQQGRKKYCSTRCSLQDSNAKRFGSTLRERFWAKVVKAGPEDCWIWQASKGSTGYGFMYVLEQRRTVGAHVISWFLEHGTWPPEDTCVLHNCPTGDRPDCVNPQHLWLGTRTENGKDMVAKDRHANQFTSVKQTTRDEIVALYLTGQWSYDGLARQYGLSSQTIYTYVRKHRESMRNQ